jgi:hypothetical protein
VAEQEPALVVLAGGEGEMPAERGIQVVDLVIVNRQQTERRHQLTQVAARRSDHEQGPVRVQNAMELGRVAGREDGEHTSHDACSDRQRSPQITDHRADAGMRSRGAARGEFGDVEGGPHRAGHPVQHRREVVARSRARVEHTGGVVAAGRDALGQQGGEGREMSLGQKPGASLHHGGRVRGAGHRVAGQEVDVPLAGDIERVPPQAPYGSVRDVEIRTAVRAGEVLDDIAEHATIMDL